MIGVHPKLENYWKDKSIHLHMRMEQIEGVVPFIRYVILGADFLKPGERRLSSNSVTRSCLRLSINLSPIADTYVQCRCILLNVLRSFSRHKSIYLYFLDLSPLSHYFQSVADL